MAVQDIEDLLDHDPEIAARHALVTLDHPHLGPFGHVATPIRFSGERIEPFRAPGIGEHVGEIVRDLAGLTDAEIADFTNKGLFR